MLDGSASNFAGTSARRLPPAEIEVSSSSRFVRSRAALPTSWYLAKVAARLQCREVRLPDVSDDSSFALPCREQKTVYDAGLPDIAIARRRNLTGITSVDSDFVRKVIIEASVYAVRVCSGKAV